MHRAVGCASRCAERGDTGGGPNDLPPPSPCTPEVAERRADVGLIAAAVIDQLDGDDQVSEGLTPYTVVSGTMSGLAPRLYVTIE